MTSHLEGLLFTNIGELVTLAPLVHAQKLTRITETDLGRCKGAWLAVQHGRVLTCGQGAPPREYRNLPAVDCAGALMLPGLVDAHTHPIFGGSRSQEFTQKLAGTTYAQIAKSGGGIQHTVRQTRETADAELMEQTAARLKRFLRHGVTTVEVKSGYGLSVSEELRLLRILRAVKTNAPQELFITCLALHAVPPEFPSVQAFVQAMTDELLPVVANEQLADGVDAFVENGYFSVADSEPLMTKARSLGLKLRVHADEFTDSDAAAAAARWGALSADHLECASAAGMAAMAKKKIVAVLLPGTSIYTKIPYANGKAFLQAGCPVALATDFNPGSCRVENLAFIATVGALHCGLDLPHAIAAVTYVPAFSLARHERKGALAPGFDADLLLYRYQSLDDWLADLGQQDPHMVFIRGQDVTVKDHL